MPDIPTVSFDDLKTSLESRGSFVLIDVLGDMSYNRAHIPGALNIGAHSDLFVSDVEAQVSNKDTEVVVYCSGPECGLSPAAARKLMDAGYTNVKHYKGGLKGWAEDGGKFEGENAAQMQELLAKV